MQKTPTASVHVWDAADYLQDAVKKPEEFSRFLLTMFNMTCQHIIQKPDYYGPSERYFLFFQSLIGDISIPLFSKSNQYSLIDGIDSFYEIDHYCLFEDGMDMVLEVLAGMKELPLNPLNAFYYINVLRTFGGYLKDYHVERQRSNQKCIHG